MLQGRAKTYAIAQAVICSLGFLSGLVGGGLLLVIGLFGTSIDPATGQESSMMLVIGWTSLLVALANLIGLIVLYYAWQGKSLPQFKEEWQRWLLMGLGLVWLVSIVGAMTLSRIADNFVAEELSPCWLNDGLITEADLVYIAG